MPRTVFVVCPDCGSAYAVEEGSFRFRILVTAHRTHGYFVADNPCDSLNVFREDNTSHAQESTNATDTAP